MSFGYSAGDALLLTQLAYKVVQNSRKACGEYDDLTREATSIHDVLESLQHEIGLPGSLIGTDGYSEELLSIACGCEKILKKLDAILVKYNALNEDERSVRKLWRSVRFGNGPIVDVEHLRAKLTYYISALTLLLNMASTGTMGRVERKMDEAGGDLRDIRFAVNRITAYLLAGNKAEGSVLTAYSGDDKNVWRELRRELNREGFSSAVIHQHKTTIKAYIKELGGRGVLDDIDPAKIHTPKAIACKRPYRWAEASEPEKENYDPHRDSERETRSKSPVSKKQLQRPDENDTERLESSSVCVASVQNDEDDDLETEFNQSGTSTSHAQQVQACMPHRTGIKSESDVVSQDSRSSHDDSANNLSEIERQNAATGDKAVGAPVRAMIDVEEGL